MRVHGTRQWVSFEMLKLEPDDFGASAQPMRQRPASSSESSARQRQDCAGSARWSTVPPP